MAPFGSLEAFCRWLWQASWQASVVVMLVVLAQWLLGDRLHPRWRLALWLLVVIRLVMPVSPPSAVSVFNLTSRWLPSGAGAASVPGSLEQEWSHGVVGRRVEVKPTQPSEPAPQESGSVVSVQRDASNSPQRWTWGRLLSALWLAGLLVAVGLLGAEVGIQNRRLRRARPVTDADTLALLQEVCAGLGWSRPPEVLLSPGLSSPALFGLWRVRLLLPEGILESFSHQQMRHIFLHEIAHLKRRDPGMNWVLLGLQALHWFNPVLWLGFARLRSDRELACDALALRHTSDREARSYASTIIRLLEEFPRPRPLPAFVGILEANHQMKRRITMIAKFRQTKAWSWLAMVVVGLVGVLTLTNARPVAQPEPAAEGQAAEASEAVAAGEVAEPLAAEAGAIAAVEALGGEVQHRDGDPAQPVVEVWISSNELKNDDLRPLATLKELRRCYLGGGPELTEAALEHLKGLSHLEEFGLDAPHQIGDAGMAVVAGWTNLTNLGLGWTPVTDAGIEKLKVLKKLRRIYLISSVPRSFGGITDASCEHLASLPNLRSVALFDAAITSKGLSHIGTMTNLTFLNLSANPYLRDQGWENLRGLKQLGALWLFDTSIGDKALRHIGTLTQLKHLCLSGTYVTSEGMAHLVGLDKLEILWLGGEMRPTLSLGGTRVDDRGLKHLAELSSLQTLVLDRTLVTEAGLATIAQSPSLKAVTLRGLPITDAGVEILKTQTNYLALILSGTRVTDAALKYAAEMPQLQEVELNETAITDEGLKQLYGLKNLKRVWLTDTQVTDAGVEALREAFPGGLDIRR